jgi:hypothetical protein
MRQAAADPTGGVGHAPSVIDVVPVAPGVWLARCECDATERFADAESGWTWVLGHPCEQGTSTATDVTDRPLIDLNQPQPATSDPCR